jgi:hypothetical protein
VRRPSHEFGLADLVTAARLASGGAPLKAIARVSKIPLYLVREYFPASAGYSPRCGPKGAPWNLADWTCTDSEIGRALGVSRQAVGAKRRTLSGRRKKVWRISPKSVDIPSEG